MNNVEFGEPMRIHYWMDKTYSIHLSNMKHNTLTVGMLYNFIFSKWYIFLKYKINSKFDHLIDLTVWLIEILLYCTSAPQYF